MKDSKVSPNYYVSKNGSLQIWDVVALLNLDFFQGNILKYIYRYKDKNGLEDLYKARAYIEKMIEITSGQNSDS